MSGESRFLPKEHFCADGTYSLLPFRFDRRGDGSYFVANEVGEFLLLPGGDFASFVGHRLNPKGEIYRRLRAKHFLTDANSSALLDQLASKYRTKKSFLDRFAKLHIFVTTLRCNQSCIYCQVTRRDEHAAGCVMSLEALRRSVDLMLACPSPAVTMEFQGGESLLAFDVIQEGVRYSREKNAAIGKQIEYVLCTNLTLLTDEHLAFLKENNVQISASLDGPECVHNRNRPYRGGGSHATVVRNIKRAQEVLGPGAISCLMTTTRESLRFPREIVDEYLRLDLRSLFVRELNPYGFAASAGHTVNYSAEEFLTFFRQVLDYIIELNRGGRTFSESYTTLILSKMLTPWPIGFVDLQSPTGAGFGVVVYNYDGDVYVSDEGRMLAEMGQTAFRLGNVCEDGYNDLFFGETMQMLASAACNEALAGCSDCAYQSYCGADPVRHFRTQGDIHGNRASSSFCQKNKGIIKHVLDLLVRADPVLERIFWAWIQREAVSNMRLPGPEWLRN